MDKPIHIFADDLEAAALAQFESAMNQPFVVSGALMPDAHTGYTLPIGAVVATRDIVVPAWVGYDIGCGMCAVPTDFEMDGVRESARAIVADIYREIPVGFAHHRTRMDWPDGNDLPRSDVLRRILDRNGLAQLGTLGGGNHFIEVGHDAHRRVWIMIHSGSRNVGHSVATHYMKLASGDGKAREGHFGMVVSSPEGQQYLTDLFFCLSFALENRMALLRQVLRIMRRYGRGDEDRNGLINRNHNHVESSGSLWIHRKGATHAEKDMMGVIPGNMRDGSFIVRGRGCPRSLCSSSHGAGRVLGRREASRRLLLSDFKSQMKGIVARVTSQTLDESPSAYKDIHNVMALQRDLVEIVAHVRPILNIKG